jgi:hypothetical protein
MRKIFSILNLLLCLELIVGPVAPRFSFFGQKAYAQTCSAGFQFDTTLNRCLTSAQTANVMNATASCQAGDVQCYKKNAEDTLKNKETNGEVDKSVANKGFVSTVVGAAAVAVPITMAIYGLKGTKVSTCTSVSYYALIGGGVSLFVGDMLANMQHKKRLKAIEEDWKKIISPTASTETNTDQQKFNGTEAQSQAFEMLARSEDSMEKAAKMKRIFFGIAMGAFAVGAALATMEAMNVATAAGSICAASLHEPKWKYSKVDEKIKNQKIYNLSQAQNFADFYVLNQENDSSLSSPSIEEYEMISKFTKDTKLDDQEILSWVKSIAIKTISELNPIATAHALPIPDSIVMEGTSSSAISSEVGKFLTQPWTRAAFGGLLAGWSLIMFNHAGSQAEASKNRAAKLREMKDEFKSASGAIDVCAPADRSDPAKPTCYCYTTEGQRNTNRTNSDVCQKLFTGKTIASGNYFGTTPDSYKGCIDSSRNFDEACSCKQTNSCMKATQGTLSGLSAGTFSMLSSGLTPVTQVSNGTLDSAKVDAASLTSNALGIMNATKKLEAKAGTDFIAKKNKAGLEIAKAANNGGAGIPANSLLGSNSSSGMPSSAGEAALMLEKEIKTADPVTVISSGAGTGAQASPAGETLEFGLSGDQKAVQETQIAEVMKQNLDYGGNDITQGSKTNIFEVLSNRYKRSGMRRLFDEKGTTPQEKAATTDINQ